MSSKIVDWHTRVLKIAKEEKIISSDLSDELVSYLGFRHFIRHSYSFQINRKSVAEIINKVPRLIDRFIEEIKFGSSSS